MVRRRDFRPIDYSKEIADERKAFSDYRKLAKRHPMHAKKLREISNEESVHAKELKALEGNPHKLHVTKHFVRERLHEPSKYRKGTFVTKEVSPKTKIILAKPKGNGKQEVQAILHKRPYHKGKRHKESYKQYTDRIDTEEQFSDEDKEMM